MVEKKLSRRETNKNKVIASALKFFIRDGIENSKISDIALDASLTERSAFRYFESKSQLVLETALLFFDKVEGNISSHLQEINSQDIPGIEKVRCVIRDYLNLFFTARKEIIFVSEAEVYLSRYGLTKYLNNKPPHEFSKEKGPLSQAIREGIKDGTVRDDEEIEYIYYNTYDAALGLMEKMAINIDKITDEVAHRRIDLFVEAATNMYIKN